LAAVISSPVISTVPGYKDFPMDVHSSLRTPSDDPLATVVEPGNAVLAALEVLAMRNPALYAILRMRQEERFINVIPLT
jgi:phosphoribosylcarboxyaminoimidazole (NCAIR) mutase